jgi:hypothetical protein
MSMPTTKEIEEGFAEAGYIVDSDIDDEDEEDESEDEEDEEEEPDEGFEDEKE